MMTLNFKFQYLIENDSWSEPINAEMEFNEKNQVEFILLDNKVRSHIFKVSFENQESYFHLIQQDGKWYGLQQDEPPDCHLKVFDGTFIDESQISNPLEKLSELIKSIPIDTAYIHQIFKTEEPINETIVTETDLYIKYAKKLEQDVIAIIEKYMDRSHQVQELQNYLQSTYKIIQGTALDYVASPDIVATQAMIEIAKIVAKEQGVSVIEVLMPGVAYEPCGVFVDLREMDIQEVIRTHHFSKKDDQLYLIPVRCLENYLRYPDEKNYYPYIHPDLEDYQLLTIDDYEHLFHHSEETEEVHEIFEELKKLSDESINLYQQLTQLGEILKKNDAQHAGEELDAGDGAYYSTENFFDYYAQLEPCQWIRKESEPTLDDLDKDVNMAYVYYHQSLYFINRYNQDNPIKKITQENQYARFRIAVISVDKLPITHQERPLIVKDSQDNFYLFGKDDTPIKLHQENMLPIYESFPKQTNHVIHLDLESIAPSGFREIFSKGFYQTSLSTEIDNQFPVNKRLSLNELNWIGLQTDHFYTDDYFFVPEDIREIVNKLRNFLLHPFEFYRIRKLPWNSKIQVETNIETCIGTLGTALRNNIPKLKQELEQIGEREELKNKIIKDIKANFEQSIEMLIKSHFSGSDQNLKCNIKSLEALFGQFIIKDISLLEQFDLNEIKPENLNLSHLDAEDISKFIDITTNEDLKIILPLIVKYIPEVSRENFFDVIQNHFNENIEELTEYLPRILIIVPSFITNSKCLGKIHQFIQYYSIDIHELVGEEKIQSLLNNANDFLNIYVCLKEDQQNTFFNEHKHLLHINLENTTMIGLLAYLNPSQKQTFLSQITISEFIQDTEDLFDILAFLDNPQFSDVLEECKGFINASEIEPLAINSEDKAIAVCRVLNDIDWPKTLEYYHLVTQKFDKKYQKIFFEQFRGKILNLFNLEPNQENLIYILKATPDAERLNIYLELLQKYPNISEYFSQVMPVLKEPSHFQDFKNNYDALPEDLKNPYFRFYFNEKYQKIFLETSQENLLTSIDQFTQSNIFLNLLNKFSDAERLNIYLELLQKHPNISEYFSQVMPILKEPSHFQDFKNNYDALPEDLKNLYFRFYEQSDQIENMIENEKDLESYISMVLAVYCTFDYWSFLQFLIKNSNISIELLSIALKKIDPEISSGDFFEILTQMPEKRMKYFYQNFKDSVVINSEKDLAYIIHSSLIYHIGKYSSLLSKCLGEFITDDIKKFLKTNHELIITKSQPLKNIDKYIKSKDWQLQILRDWTQSKEISHTNALEYLTTPPKPEIYNFLRNEARSNLSFIERRRLGICFANRLASISEKDLVCENNLDKELSYIVIAQKYIQKLEHDLFPYHFELKEEDEFSKLTQKKLDIMTESLKILAQEENNIKDVKIYLESKEKILSKHRNKFLMKYFHQVIHDKLYFIYDCLRWMLGYPATAGIKTYLFSQKNSTPESPTPNKSEGPKN